MKGFGDMDHESGLKVRTMTASEKHGPQSCDVSDL